MKSNSLKFNRLQEQIFRELCKTTGSKTNQGTLAKRLGVTSAAVAKALPVLEKSDLVVITEHKMKLKEIELNRENHRAIDLKRVENLRQLYTSGFVDHLAEIYAGCAVILFGSYSKGEDTITSDIDIAIIGKEKPLDLKEYEKTLERPIRIMYTTHIAKLSREFRESLFNGIVLAEHLEL